jgi:hypothetical protein
VGFGELDDDQIETRVHKGLPRFGPQRVTTYVCLSDFIAMVFTTRCVQWRCRLDLAKVMSSRGFDRSGGGGEKVSRPILELRPNLLYAKVRSQDCSPSRLQIDTIGRT